VSKLSDAFPKTVLASQDSKSSAYKQLALNETTLKDFNRLLNDCRNTLSCSIDKLAF